MVKILFWNVQGVEKGHKLPSSAPRYQNLSNVLVTAAKQRTLDIIILAESPFGGSLPIAGFQNAPTSLRPNRKTQTELEIYFRGATTHLTQFSAFGRTTFQEVCVVASGLSFLLIATHLESPLHSSEERRREAVRDVAGEILSVENRRGNRQTLLVGDLNYDPFDMALIHAQHLRAVSTHQTALHFGKTSQKQRAPFFYNPMWSRFGDSDGTPAGTYYRGTNEVDCRFWHLFDQVLLRPEMLPHWDDRKLKIFDRIGRKRLVTQEGFPDKVHFSDHLPIQFEINL